MEYVNVIAHRGANVNAPQNTLPAFEKAIELGCDGFETDIHLTKDGIPVVCHNFTIDETSNGKGEIKDYTFDELREFDFGAYKGEEFKGTKIPTLDEFLDVYAKKKMRVLDIELKSRIIGESGTELAKKTVEAVIEHGLIDTLLISSFDPALLVVCKKIDKRCKTGLLYVANSTLGARIALRPFKYAEETGCDALHPMYLHVNSLYVKMAHEKGLQVNAWTVDNEKIAKTLVKMGVDGLISDCPDTMNKLLGRTADFYGE